MNERRLINFEGALENLANNKDLYKDLLNYWFDEAQFDEQKFDTLLPQKNEAASYIHRMKGAAGSLGAEQLFDAAQRTEDLLRGKTQGDLKSSIVNLANLYQQTTAALRAIQMNL